MQRSGKIRLFMWIVSRQDWYIIGRFELCIFGRSNELPHWLDRGFWPHLWVLLLRLASFYEHIFPAADMGLDDWRDPTEIFLIPRLFTSLSTFIALHFQFQGQKAKTICRNWRARFKEKENKNRKWNLDSGLLQIKCVSFWEINKNSNIDIVSISVILWEVKKWILTPQYPQIVTKMFWI